MKWIQTTKEQLWQERAVDQLMASGSDTFELTGGIGQTMKGFGGCFNELGAMALKQLPEERQQEILKELFNQKTGCGFNFCRMPIGASDYAGKWYSHNEVENDYEMKEFNIDRDKEYLLPYIKAAMVHNPELKFFASPWSPPTWMKQPPVYNYGTLRMEPEILRAYALYFQKFVENYSKEGIKIEQVHIQNEPYADQKFPSCKWTPEQMRIFIRDYLGPCFEKEAIPAEIWLGTLNGPEDCSFTMLGMALNNYNRNLDHVLFDADARKYIKGVGYQWAGKNAIARTQESWPELQLMQTENECGDGRNSWEYAEYVFGLIRHYIRYGVNAYVYWNMVLEPGGASTWGWNQNAMITVDPLTKSVNYNPEFYVMKHYSHFVKPGAVRLDTKGHWNSMASAFRNPNGEIILVVQNALERVQQFTYDGNGIQFTVLLEPNSFNTFII